MTRITATSETLANPPAGVINAYGSLLKLDPEDSLFLGSHDYEVYETKLMMGLIRRGDIAVDVGAMIGYYTLLLARNVGPQGRVYAFEPDPRNFALLEESIAMNSYDQVTPRRAVVGATSGMTTLFPAPEQFRGDNRAYSTGGREGVQVEMVALDDLIDEPVNIVKIDVQGYERHVLAGMTNLIERSKSLTMFVEYAPTLLLEAGTDPRELLDSLRGCGFRLFEIEEEKKEVGGVDVDELLLRSRDEVGDLHVGYTNLLCVKEAG